MTNVISVDFKRTKVFFPVDSNLSFNVEKIPFVHNHYYLSFYQDKSIGTLIRTRDHRYYESILWNDLLSKLKDLLLANPGYSWHIYKFNQHSNSLQEMDSIFRTLGFEEEII